MKIQLIKLNENDHNDISKLEKIHKMPSISSFVAISDNYFDYVTSTAGVAYYKILYNDILVGGLHTEIVDRTMCLCICVDENYRRIGIAEASLNQLFAFQTTDIEKIEVYIDENNIPSLNLFAKVGFNQVCKDDGAIKMQKQK